MLMHHVSLGLWSLYILSFLFYFYFIWLPPLIWGNTALLFVCLPWLDIGWHKHSNHIVNTSMAIENFQFWSVARYGVRHEIIQICPSCNIKAMLLQVYFDFNAYIWNRAFLHCGIAVFTCKKSTSSTAAVHVCHIKIMWLACLVLMWLESSCHVFCFCFCSLFFFLPAIQ